MNRELLGELVKLRYKLTWAKTRSRNGKIAIFLTGYLLLVLLLMLFAAGGLGAGVASVRSGKAELVAQIVLTSIFAQAILATVMLGFGMNAIFSDLELRRYPLAAADRLFARHVVGILDPFWFLVLVFDLGLPIGLYIAGAASPLIGLVAVLLLFVSNYLLARVIGLLVDRLMQRKAGSMVMMALVMSLAMLPGLLAPLFKKNPEVFSVIVDVFRFSPGFGAAAAMTRGGWDALSGLGLLAVWMMGLVILLAYVDRRPARAARVQTTVMTWESPYDRVAQFFGPRDAPLVSNWLRFYMRNTRCRTIMMLTLPLAGFLTFQMSRQGTNPHRLFLAGMGSFAMVPFMGTSRIAVNQFGYVGGAFRRFFLFPTDPAATLRTGSYASMLLGAALLPAAALAWLFLAPSPFDARSFVMLMACGVAGLFWFHMLGLWCTLFGPRKGDYNASLGNDLSALGNVVVVGGIFAVIFLPRVLEKVAPFAVSPAGWWIPVAVALATLGLYALSLRAAGAVFVSRRERLLAVVEGRD